MRRNLRNIEKTINKNYSSIADYQIKQQSKLDRIYAVTDDIYNMLEKLHSYPINGSCLLHGKLLLKLVNIELDRKILADLAVREPESFKAVVIQAKNALQG